MKSVQCLCVLHSKCDFTLNLTAFNWAFRMCSTWLLVILTTEVQWSLGCTKILKISFQDFTEKKKNFYVHFFVYTRIHLYLKSLICILPLICFVKQHSNLGESSATMALICDSRSRRVLPVIWYRWSVSHFLKKKTHFIISCPCSYLFNILSQSLLLSCSNNYKADGSSSRTEREWGGNEVCIPVSMIENEPLLTMCLMYWSQARGHTLKILYQEQKSTSDTLPARL